MDPYRLAILVVYGLSAHSLAAHFYARRLRARGVSYTAVYGGVMSLVVIWGLTLFDAADLFGALRQAWLLSLAAGLAAGALAAWSDRAIVRRFARRSLAPDRRSRARRQAAPGGQRVTRVRPLAVSGKLARRREMGLPGAQQTMWQPLGDRRYRLAPLLAVAVLEELIYRGFLVQAAFLLPGPFLVAGALALSALVFALAHITFGWPHVLAKLPLGLLALLAVVALGTVLPAIIAHLVFNLRVWNDWRRQPQLVVPAAAARDALDH